MAKEGRPEIPIDTDKLKMLMNLYPSLEETAHFFECTARTIERFIRKNYRSSFVEFRDKNMVHTKLAIKRKMIEKAKAGDNTMMIWISKNMMGFSDKLEQSGSDKKPVTFKVKYE